jgi:hypothetical protein
MQWAWDKKCRLRPGLRGCSKNVSAGWVNERSCISDDGSFAYFRLPKCANTTVMKTLVSYDPGKQAYARNFDQRLVKKAAYRTLGDLSREEYGQVLTSAYTFSIVRHPSVRVVSAYRDKIMGNKPQAEVVCDAFQVSSGAELSFRDFLSWLEAGNLYTDPHWAPQWELLPIDPANLSFVGKVEHLAHDLDHIMQRIFGQPLVELRNDTPWRTDADQAARSMLEAHDHERIYQLYRGDFEAFDYKALYEEPLAQPAPSTHGPRGE